MRVPRSLIVLPNYSVHKMWRGHNKEWNLRTDADKTMYLEFLNQDFESKKFKTGSVLNALTLMDTHDHQLSKVLNQILYSGHLRRHHSRYGSYFNRKND